MPRFFKEDFKAAPYLEGDDARHAAKALRVRIGEELTVCDLNGFDYICSVSEVTADRVYLDIKEVCPNKTEPSVFVTLYQCLTKGDKMDTIVRQAVECGVSKIVPVLSENCVSRPDEKSLGKKIERWQKIADEAAGQSGRGILPKVEKALSLKQVAGEINSHDKVFFFYEAGGVPMQKEDLKTAAIIIGPEGGFSPDEASLLEKSGAKVTTLGPRILRAETAPVAALSILMFNTGNM